MNTELSTRSSTPAIRDDMSLRELGEILAKSGFFKDTRDAAQACVKVLFGRELGVGPVTAMTGIHIIEGRPQVGAHLIAAAIKRSARYDYRVLRHDAEGCEIAFFQQSQEIGRYAYTMADAQRAGLGGRGPWKAHPRAMLFARTIGQGYRTHCPDVFSMAVYAEGEIDESVIISNPPEAQPTAPKVDEPEPIAERDIKPSNLKRDAIVMDRPAPEQVQDPPRKPANSETGNISTDTKIDGSWAAVLGEPLTIKLRGKALYDEQVNGALAGIAQKVAAGALVVDERIGACLGIAMQCARRRLLAEMKSLGIGAESYAEIATKLKIGGKLNDLEPWDLQRVRDALERRVNRAAKDAAKTPNKEAQKASEKRAADAEWERGSRRQADAHVSRDIERHALELGDWRASQPHPGEAWDKLCMETIQEVVTPEKATLGQLQALAGAARTHDDEAKKALLVQLDEWSQHSPDEATKLLAGRDPSNLSLVDLRAMWRATRAA